MIPTTTPTLPIDPDRAWVSLGELLARADSVRGILCKENEREFDINIDSRREQRQGVDLLCLGEEVNGKEDGRFRETKDCDLRCSKVSSCGFCVSRRESVLYFVSLLRIKTVSKKHGRRKSISKLFRFDLGPQKVKNRNKEDSPPSCTSPPHTRPHTGRPNCSRT